MQNIMTFIETNISVIGLIVGVLAAIIAIVQLYLQGLEMKRGNRINSLESLANMLRNEMRDKQDLLQMNKGKIEELEARGELSDKDTKYLKKQQDAKYNRSKEIYSLYNGLLSVNTERCKLMENIEEDLDENVSKAIEDMRKMFERRK